MENKSKVAAGIGLGIGVGALLLLSKRAEAAPPAPPPGLANLYGRVTDASTGKSIAGVKVILNSFETFTNAQGAYTLTNIEPGGYRLEFSKTGYETAVY